MNDCRSWFKKARKVTFLHLQGKILFLLTLIGLTLNVFPKAAAAQNFLNLEAPFEKCWTYPLSPTSNYYIASDNGAELHLISNDGLVKEINILDGQEIWRTDTGGDIQNEPVSTKDYIYLTNDFEETKNQIEIKKPLLRAVRKPTGITDWQIEIMGVSEPFISTTLIGNSTELFVFGSNGSVLVLDQNSGKILRDFTIPLNSFRSGRSENSKEISAVKYFDNSKILVTQRNDISLVSLANGDILWRIISKKNVTSTANLGNILYWGDNSGQIVAANVGGNQIWSIKTGGKVSSLSVTEKELIATSYDNFIYAFSKNSGKLFWKRRTLSRITDKPLIIGNFLITVSYGSRDIEIVSLDKGKIVNRISLGTSEFFIGSPKQIGKFLVFQTSEGISVYSNQKC